MSKSKLGNYLELKYQIFRENFVLLENFSFSGKFYILQYLKFYTYISDYLIKLIQNDKKILYMCFYVRASAKRLRKRFLIYLIVVFLGLGIK